MKAIVKYDFTINSTKLLVMAIANSGQSYVPKSGVFAIRLIDNHGHDVSDKANLFYSKKLNKHFLYAGHDKSGDFFNFPEIKAIVPFTHVCVEYFPIYTETPIKPGHLGRLLYSAGTRVPHVARLIHTIFPSKVIGVAGA